MTLPEVLLWTRLRGNLTGFRFRRQHPIGPYVTDFFCPSARLIVEIDGIAHDAACRPQADAARDRFMHDNGLRVVRFAAAEILREPDAVAASIAALVATATPVRAPPVVN